MTDSLNNQTARLVFIGAGNMANSIIGGLVSHGYPAQLITATDPNAEQLDKLAQETGINTSTDNAVAVADSDAIILAVKPQVMEAVTSPLKDIIANNKPLIISIAAGITVANLLDWMGEDLPVIRTMPNTPALVQTGATGLFANNAVSKQQKSLANTVFSAIGIASWFNQESDLDAVVAVSGSGPAYFFMMMEAMEEAGVKLGLSAESARELTLQTALGAAKLAQASDVSTAELRRRVTSPGGTTEQAIKCFEEGGLRELVDTALQAASKRSKELAG
jgi:pyrroline-5-carboxylate reductase